MGVRERLLKGMAIPAHPLALTAERKLDEKRQRALTRYYLAAGAGGVAIGVHTTQFAIHDPKVGLLRPVLEIGREEAKDAVTIAGVCGGREQAVRGAELARSLRYDAGLVSLAALRDASEDELIDHCRAVASIIPVVGFYLQPAVGGRVLPYSFWRRFVEIRDVVAIKIAPFNRYQTIDVIRAVAESGRAGEIALYTGNDDNIVADLTTEFDFGGQRLRIVGGLLGQWAVWTAHAAALVRDGGPEPGRLTLGAQITDANAAIFDAANSFRGCIPGIHEVLRRQGLLAGRWCFDEREELSPGQSEEIERVIRAYPWLCEADDRLIAENVEGWLR
ncbi:MAG TPA: dihydrodipicolinate synthase family protein [Bryobacteraceae bacterium]|nr:dihydrodipicolinate synthase family protein [Bryobacteraceae bacterium]